MMTQKTTKPKFWIHLLLLVFTFVIAISSTQAVYAASTKNIYLRPKKTYQIKISGVSKSKPKYTSKNTTIAVVNKTGRIIAKRTGTTTITARYKSKTYKYNVHIQNPKLNRTTASIYKNKTTKLTLIGVTKTDKIKWYTANSKIATVSQKGTVKGKKAGTTTITAVCHGWKFKCKVKIVNPPAKPAVSGTASSTVQTDTTVTNKILALKSTYPQGKTWNNSVFYAWKGGIYAGGYGCAALAFKISDTLFTKAARYIKPIVPANIRPGDIIMYSYHTVLVIKNDKVHKTVTIVEGNYNNAINWGRKISYDEINKEIIAHLTRW